MCCIVLTNKLPVKHFPEVVKIAASCFTVVVEPVCVLPEVKAENRCALDLRDTHHQVVVMIIRLCYDEVAIWSEAKPNPSRQVSSTYLLLECLFKAREVGEVLVDLSKELQKYEKVKDLAS
jgi:hypothetical protein